MHMYVYIYVCIYIYTHIICYVLDIRDIQNGIDGEIFLSDYDIGNILSKNGIKLIGQGAYGIVYRYENKYNGFEIAVKQVLVGFQNHKMKEKAASLKLEIKILKKLKHKHIVRYYDMIETNQSISLLMEYVNGGTIYDLISKQGSLPEKEVSKYCQQILKGLGYLHEANIGHRDLKCANILLADYKTCKLADFGISKEDIRSLSGCKTFCGTIYWMSPECIRGQDYGYKCDIWSFGCIALEMLNGEPPYRAMKVYAAMLKIENKGLNPSFPTGTSDHCLEFIKMCVQKEPQKRPSTTALLGYKFISKYNDV